MLALCGMEGWCTFHFDSSTCSAYINVSEQPKAIAISKTIVDSNFIHTIVTERNTYYILLSAGMKQRSKLSRWRNMISTVKSKMKQYWSKDPMISTPFFSALFYSYECCASVTVMINLKDMLCSKSEIVNCIRERLKTLLTSFQGLCTDKNMVCWKEQLRICCFTSTQHYRVGVKLLVLYDLKLALSLTPSCM
jgi:hypothetical protein